MTDSPKTGWQRRLQRILKWVGGTLLGLLLLISLAVYLVLSFPERLLPIVNPELENALPGTLSIDRVSAVTWNGATGVDLTLRGIEGEVLARAFDVSVKTSWRQLISELLSNDTTLNISAESITLEALHVDLTTTRDGALRLVQALVDNSDTNADPSSTSVLLEFKKIRIVHAWVYGDVEGMPLDTQLTELTAMLSLNESSLEIERLATSVQARKPAVYAPSIQLKGHCAIHFLEDDLKLNTEATLISDGALIEAMFSLTGNQVIKAQASGTVPRALLTRLALETSKPTEFVASAQGTPADLTTQLLLKNGRSQLKLHANILTSSDLKLRGRAELTGIDGSLFDLPELNDLDANLKWSAERSDTPSLELDRWKASVEGSVRHLKIQEGDLPPLSFQAEYEKRVARAWVEEQRSVPTSRIEATALLSPQGLKTLKAKGTVRAQQLSAYLADFDSRGVVSFEGKLTSDLQSIDADLSGNLRNVRASETFKADRLTFVGGVSGRLSNPRVQLNAHVQHAYLSGKKFKNADVAVQGTLSSSRVRAQGVFEGREIEAAATLGLSSDGLRVADGRLALLDDESKSSISVESVRVVGDRVVFSHLRLEGLGTSDLSGHWSPRSVKLQGHIRKAPLQKIAGLASVQLPLSGLVDLDAELSAERGTSVGEMSLTVADLKFDDDVLGHAAPQADIKLKIVGEGRHLLCDLDATLPSRAPPERSSDIEIHTRVSTPHSWNRLPPGPLLEQLVSIEGRVALQAAQISQFTERGAEAEGQIFAEFEATRQPGYPIPQVQAQIETRQLALTILNADSAADGNAPTTRIEEIDFKITAQHDPVTKKSETRVEILEKGVHLGFLEADLDASLTPLVEGRKDTLASAPLALRLAVPPFQLETLPESIRPTESWGLSG